MSIQVTIIKVLRDAGVAFDAVTVSSVRKEDWGTVHIYLKPTQWMNENTIERLVNKLTTSYKIHKIDNF